MTELTGGDASSAVLRSTMEVFLVPLGGARYELYCEHMDDPVDSAEPPRGFVRRLVHRFTTTLAVAEQERRAGRPAAEQSHEPRSWTRRIRDRVMCWLAEAVAEQRLLWTLRRERAAALLYPDDITREQAEETLRASLRKDAERHRFWLIVDSIGFIASALVFLVPGPNVIAYYFAFRLVGHYLSMRGARQGLDAIVWSPQPSAPLTELRAAVSLDPALRERHVHDVATRLNLEHLAAFFERTAAVG